MHFVVTRDLTIHESQCRLFSDQSSLCCLWSEATRVYNTLFLCKTTVWYGKHCVGACTPSTGIVTFLQKKNYRNQTPEKSYILLWPETTSFMSHNWVYFWSEATICCFWSETTMIYNSLWHWWELCQLQLPILFYI